MMLRAEKMLIWALCVSLHTCCNLLYKPWWTSEVCAGVCVKMCMRMCGRLWTFCFMWVQFKPAWTHRFGVLRSHSICQSELLIWLVCHSELLKADALISGSVLFHECESRTSKTSSHKHKVLKVPYCTLFWSLILGFDVLKNIYLRYKYQKPSQYIFLQLLFQDLC